MLEGGVEGEGVGDIPDHLESIGDCAKRGEAEIGGVERTGDAWCAGGGSERSVVEIVAIEIGGGLVVKTQPRAEYDLFSYALEPCHVDGVRSGSVGVAVVAIAGVDGTANFRKAAIEAEEEHSFVALVGTVFGEGERE